MNMKRKIETFFKGIAWIIFAFVFIKCNSSDEELQKVDFTSDVKSIYETNGVNFRLVNPEAVDECTWFFEGGEPENYNQANPPTIYYGKAGLYSVTLNVVSDGQKQVISKEDFILVQIKPEGQFSYISINAERDKIKAGESIKVWVVALGENLVYEWASSTGTIEGEGAEVTFKTGFCFEGIAQVSATVSNEFGTMERTVDIHIERKEL